MRTLIVTTVTAASAALLGACAGTHHGNPHGMSKADHHAAHHGDHHAQHGVPAAVQVPAGHRVAMKTVGVGQITWECRAKADAPNGHAWAFAGPVADLMSPDGAKVGRYFGPPATWAANDGSAITGTQIGLAPGAAGSIPLQLVKANPASSAGAMQGVTHVQRLATRGGVAPSRSCDGGNMGERAIVSYQADYLFWKAV